MNYGQTIASFLEPFGLDIVEPFDVSLYNESIVSHPSLKPLPTFGRNRTYGLLIGNTHQLWPVFLKAMRQSADLRTHSDPLDYFVTQAVKVSLESIPVPTQVRFAHTFGDEMVSMQRLADISGFAWTGPAHLAIHSQYGPWFALRAVIVMDLKWSTSIDALTESPCIGCEAPCREAYELALKAGLPVLQNDGESSVNWEAWVAVRDACPVGVSYRYGSDQIQYHYSKDREALLQRVVSSLLDEE